MSGLDTVSGQQAGKREINGKDGRLSDRRLAKIFVSLSDGDRIFLIHKNKICKWLSEQGCHHTICLLKSLATIGSAV